MLGKGYSPVDYTLLCYGGGGPLHVAGYTDGVPYRDVLVPAWAAGFSAFGCACGDFAYRYDLTIDMPIEPAPTPTRRRASGCTSTAAGRCCASASSTSSRSPGSRRPDRVPPLRADAVLRPAERPRDLLAAHGDRGGEHVDDLIAAFEDAYGKLYARSARSPELGYLVTNVIVNGSVEVEKPALPTSPRAAGRAAGEGERDGLVARRLRRDADLRAGHVEAGQRVAGPA